MTSTTSATELSEAELHGIRGVLEHAGVHVSGALTAQRVTGGRSNLTYVLHDGLPRWVLRMPPRAGRTASAHDVAREYRVTSALHGTEVPVPAAVVLCEDDQLLGGPFAIADYVPGRTVQSQADLGDLDDASVGILARGLIEVLVTLHRVDPRAIGLEGFGRHSGYAERQLKRWAAQWELVGTPDLAGTVAELVRRLGARVPEQTSLSVVHGDYRIDNTILDLDGEPRIAAVVDWELSTLGDPVADVATMCAYRDPVFDLIVGSPSAWTSPRLPDLGALAEAYEDCRGARLAHWDYYLALAYFKIGVIAAGIDYRRRSGGAAGTGFDTSGRSVPVYFELALGALSGAE